MAPKLSTKESVYNWLGSSMSGVKSTSSVVKDAFFSGRQVQPQTQSGYLREEVWDIATIVHNLSQEDPYLNLCDV